jgi:hypothetical protein
VGRFKSIRFGAFRRQQQPTRETFDRGVKSIAQQATTPRLDTTRAVAEHVRNAGHAFPPDDGQPDAD